MPAIHKLDSALINKIAAGEVIERPASVVKELVENSLDAAATRITVSIKEGGKKLIQIVDDGRGIASDQLELAIERHATSKIDSYDDLFRLSTKGFRGEALASISGVAQLTLASKTADGEPMELLVDSGEILDKRACAQPDGTTVTVKYLFHKTPARLKFLRTDDTEMGHIADVMAKMALSHPLVAFELLQNERVIFLAPVTNDPFTRVLDVLGRELGGYLYPFSGEDPGMRVDGYIGHPQVAKSQRTGAYFFVNGRAVNDKVIWHAIMEAHRDLLMKGKYPVIVLHLTVDEGLVDVNVHPTKAEIRFQQSQAVHGFLYRTLRDKLTQAPWLAKAASDFADGGKEPVRLDFPIDQVAAVGAQEMKSTVNHWSERYFSGQDQEPTFFQSAKRNSEIKDEWVQNPVPAPTQKTILFGKTRYASMTVIGQLLGTYILCQAEDRLVLIDQHAAHERVGFEKLMLSYQRDGITSQPLLIAETFDLKPSDVEILKRYLDDLKPFGFEIDFFGGNTFVLKAVPDLLTGVGDIKTLVGHWIDDLKETGTLVSLKDKVHHVLATMSCHAQIRANHHLETEEIYALLKELEAYQFTDFCPHGRPVSVEVTRDEIERWFKRVL